MLGKDPITGQPVPQDAMTLIGGFMKLIGEEEIFENMKKANALPRAWAWFNKALGELKLFVQQIPPTFIGALKALGVADMILIILDEWFIEIGSMNYSFGHGIAEWSFVLLPSKLVIVLALAILFATC